MYRNAERYGENLKTFYVGNTNIMKEDEKKKILKHYNPEVLPINLTHEIYKETEGLDPLTKMSDPFIKIANPTTSNMICINNSIIFHIFCCFFFLRT